jgi:hypothetical protein
MPGGLVVPGEVITGGLRQPHCPADPVILAISAKANSR